MTRNRSFLRKPDAIVHVYNRGANRGQLFHRNRDYELFVQLLTQALIEFPVSLLAYTLMPNHFHLVLHQHEPYAISDFMKKVCQAYAQWLNGCLGKSGPLFERRYGGVEITNPEGLLRVTHYVHMNAVAARLVPAADKWHYSSCGAYLDDGRGIAVNSCSLVWALAGDASAYKCFLERYDPAYPASAAEYLCPEATEIWAKKRKMNPKRKAGEVDNA
jgi:REP element-mobilizing transposase RayT